MQDDLYEEEKSMAKAMRTLLSSRDTLEMDKNENYNELFKRLPDPWCGSYFYEHDIRDVPSAKQMLLTAHGVEIKYNEFSGKDNKFNEFYKQAFEEIQKMTAVNSK